MTWQRVRVLVWLRTPEHEDVMATYLLTSKQLAGTVGLLGSELIRSLSDPASYVVVSEWESMDAFPSIARPPPRSGLSRTAPELAAPMTSTKSPPRSNFT
jgi:quinol monooxygenase YgiN